MTKPFNPAPTSPSPEKDECLHLTDSRNPDDLVAFRYKNADGKPINAAKETRKALTKNMIISGIISAAGFATLAFKKQTIPKWGKVLGVITGVIAGTFAAFTGFLRHKLNDPKMKEIVDRIGNGDVIVEEKKEFDRLMKTTSPEERRHIEVVPLSECTEMVEKFKQKQASQQSWKAKEAFRQQQNSAPQPTASSL